MKNPLTIFLVILFALNANAQKDWQFPEHFPIIDIHMHTGMPHKVLPGTPALCRPAPCQGEGEAITNSEKLMKKTLEQMDRYNIVKAFLSGTDLNAVREWKKAAPERFIASPFILKPAKDELEKLRPEYTSGQFQGLGEIGVQLNGIPPNDPSLEPYFQLAVEYDLPVLIHTLGIGPYTPHFRSAAGSPLLLEDG